MSSKVILSEFVLGGQTLRNRVVLAPMTRARTDDSRIPNSHMGDYYEQRASAGLLISEATAVSEQGYGYRFSPGIYSAEQVAAWRIIVDRVHAKGGVMYLQLWHVGRQSHSSFHKTPDQIVSASAIAAPGEVITAEGKREPYEVPRALPIDEIPAVVEQFRTGAAMAKAAGFDGVEIHSAHGHLIDQFLQSCSNVRTDAYGGSIENRSRLLFEVIDAVKLEFPSNRIGFRITPNSPGYGMGSPDNFELFTYVAQKADKLELAYLHIMDGMAFGFHGKGAVVTAAQIRKFFSGPIICNGGLTVDVAEGMVRSGAADLVAFARPFMSNPDLVERFRNGLPLSADAEYQYWASINTSQGYSDFPTAAEASKPISVGANLPAIVLQEYNEAESKPDSFDIAKASAGKTIVLFGLPGAFSPTCSDQHVPGYVEKFNEFKQHGVDEIWCISANDVFVVGAWARELKTNGAIRFLADGSGDFARAVKLVQDLSSHGMGVRSARFSMLVRDGKINVLNVEASGKFEVSDAQSLLRKLS